MPDLVSLPLWIHLTLLLSASGTIGGLAFHLVKNEGVLRLPGMRRKGSTRSLDGGFLSDIVIGIAAGNGVHLALGGLISYQPSVEDTNKIFLMFVSFGVLAGFGGATVLRALSRKLHEGLDAEKLDQVQEQIGQMETSSRLFIEERVHQAVADRLLYRTSPTMFDDLFLNLRVEQILASPENERTPIDLLIQASHLYARQQWTEIIPLIEKALRKTVPDDWCWVAHNLLGLAHHYSANSKEPWAEKAAHHYQLALECAAKKSKDVLTRNNQTGVTQTNMAYLALDLSDYVRAKQNACDALVAIGSTDSSIYPQHIADVTRLALSTALACLGEESAALETLQQIASPALLAFLFQDDSISVDGKLALLRLVDLPEWLRQYLAPK